MAAGLAAPWGLFEVLQVAPSRADDVDFIDYVRSKAAAAVAARSADPEAIARAEEVLARPTWLALYRQLWCSKTYYEALGVTVKATADRIKRAYRELCMKAHPDKRAGLLDSVRADPAVFYAIKTQIDEDFKWLGHMYTVLTEHREAYTAAGNPQRFGPNADDADDVDADFADDAWAADGTECEEASTDWSSSAEAEANGRRRERRRSKRKRGAGKAGRAGGKRKRSGAGSSDEPPHPSGPTPVQRIVITATVQQLWQGFVRSIQVLRGIKTVKKTDSDPPRTTTTWDNEPSDPVVVPIKPRSQPGTVFEWPGYGHYDVETKQLADVHVVVEVTDVHFTVEGADIHTVAEIGFADALIGLGTLNVRMPEDPLRMISRPFSKQIRDGDQVVIAQGGLRYSDSSDLLFGNLVATVRIRYPPIIDARCAQALRVASDALFNTDPSVSRGMANHILGPPLAIEDLC